MLFVHLLGVLDAWEWGLTSMVCMFCVMSLPPAESATSHHTPHVRAGAPKNVTYWCWNNVCHFKGNCVQKLYLTPLIDTNNLMNIMSWLQFLPTPFQISVSHFTAPSTINRHQHWMAYANQAKPNRLTKYICDWSFRIFIHATDVQPLRSYHGFKRW